MSPEAKRLVELTEDSHGHLKEDVRLSQLIKDHPELTSGLDEYLKHRDDKVRAVCENQAIPAIGHSMRKKH